MLEFQFPKHLKAHYNQYLTYFGKVLLDQGINANVSLIERGESTHLIINVDESVIGAEELTKMLLAYISLPSLSESEINCDTYNIATDQLLVNLKYFKSQLSLSQAKSQDYSLVNLLDKESRNRLFKEVFSTQENLTYKLLELEIKLNKEVGQ